MNEPASKSCSPKPPIIDCPDPYKPSQRQRRLGIITAIGTLSAALVVSFVAAFGPPGSSKFVMYLPPLLIIMLLWLVLSRAYLGGKKFKEIPEGNAGTPTDDDIIALCKPDFWDTGTRMGTLVKRLHAQSVTGRCIRICHVDNQFLVEPLTLPFEPIPLDQAEAGFANLMEQPVQGIAVTAKPSTELTSKFNRNVLLAGGRLSVGLFGFIWLMHAIEALMKWRVTWPFIFWSLFFALMLFGFGGRGAWTWRRQWLLVPGGLFSRHAKIFKRNWQTHLFKASDSTLLLRNAHRNIWSACLFDGVSFSRAGMTQSEAQMLLRAWLSPLPTPTFEQLSDLV